MATLKKELFEWIKAIALALVLFGILNIFITTTTVFNTSMLPTLVEQDRLFMQRTSDVQHGDIISFETEIPLRESDLALLNPIQRMVFGVKTMVTGEEPKKNLIKRVIGVPGDTVEVLDGVVTVNGEVLNEPYINTITTDAAYYENIPEGKYFVMGDNRVVSLDSRNPSVGLIDGDKIIGRALFRFFPLNKIGGIDK